MLMMDYSLTIGMMMERAEKFFPKKEIISQTHDTLHRLTYKEIGKRTRKLMSALHKLGVQQEDRVGTLAWNTHHHLQIYFAATCMSDVLHTINKHIASEYIVYFINHAEDQDIFVDEDILPLVDQLKDHLKTVKAYIVMTYKDTIPENNL